MLLIVQRRTTNPHLSKYPNPISFQRGDAVTVTRRDAEYPGWIRTHTADGNEGWAPESLLDVRSDGTAIALADYTAQELDTEAGEIVEVIRELNGWYWVVSSNGEEGWIPVATTEEA